MNDERPLELSNVVIDQVLMSYAAGFSKPKMLEIIEPMIAEHDAQLVAPLKKQCDRDWKDETPEQIVAIACNAIYWRTEAARDDERQKAELLVAGARLEEAKWWRYLVQMHEESYFAVEGDKRIAQLEAEKTKKEQL
ncbi:MAG: hypothetical protein OK457_00550 [Thaumarchaeota archaeon]|nr:hypothetical protein [Nitrososphaerota archaeon]